MYRLQILKLFNNIFDNRQKKNDPLPTLNIPDLQTETNAIYQEIA